MTETMSTNWTNPPPDGKRFAAAFAVGLLLELTAVLALVTVVAQQPPPSDTPTVVKLSVLAPSPPKPPAPKPKPVPPPPKPVPPPPPLPVTPPLPLPPPPPVPRPAQHVFRHYIKPRIQTPPPKIQPPVTPTPPTPAPPPAPAAPNAGELDRFRAAMQRAVSAAAKQMYPPAAEMAHETGQPEVSFTYLNGVISDVTLVQSSGFPLLDQAALQVVRDAAYPAPPPDFVNHAFPTVVVVLFQPDTEDVDGD